MAYEKNATPEGKVGYKFEDGYHIDPMDPLAATEELAKSRDDRARVAREEKLRADNLQTELDKLKTPPPPTTPAQQSELELQRYLVDQTARGLGFKDAEEYKKELARVQNVVSKVNEGAVVADFLQACPDFSNTPQDADILGKKIEEMGWDFNTKDMIAAHAMIVRENAQDPTKGYKPLSAEEVNASWANRMQSAERPKAPPMIPSGSPDSQPQPNTLYNEPLDKMRARILNEGRQQT